MSDQAKSNDTRFEIDAVGHVLQVTHETKATLTDGLRDWFVIDGVPAAVMGSSGPNRGEHRQPKVGQALVPIPTKVTVLSGDGLVEVGGRPIATVDSKCQLPDVQQPVKSGVLEAENEFFFVNDKAVVRGRS